jgi:Mn-dependent DtxR family transcriptional regulator
VQKLDAAGLVVAEKYRGLILTPAGEKVGKEVRDRHRLLTRLLAHLGLDAETIYRDVEGMEHHISPPTLRALRELADELDRQPEMLARIRARLDGDT